MTEQRELVQCTHCRKRFFVDGFKVNRLGRRLRTCLECNERGRVRALCPHGHRRHDCRGCGGSQMCSHDRRRSQCRDCGGSQMCIHGRQRPRCRDCGGVSFCPHGRLRFSCRDCGGSQVCPCGRQRFQCWSCNPVGALWSRACTRIFSAIGTKARAGRSIEYILGCGKKAFFNHIAVLFTIPGNEGMCWDRISEIDIDHCVPIGYPGATGGPPTLDEKVARLHYRNCQPLWSYDNRIKGNRRADPAPQLPADTLQITDDELAELLASYT